LGIYETQNHIVWAKCTIYYVKAGGSPFKSLPQGFRELEFIKVRVIKSRRMRWAGHEARMG
jgi:hypothetical protein